MAGIPFVRQFDFAYGRADQVSPRLRRVICNNPGPFTFTGTGTYLIGAGEDVAVLDPGPDDAAHLEALVRALDGRRVSAIVLTHSHMDHSPLAKPLQARVDAPILGRRVRAAGGEASEAAEDDSFRPDRELGEGDTVAGDGWTLTTLETPGHASNHLAFALEEENALLSGDHVMGWSTTIVSPPDGDMGEYFASLDKVMARCWSVIYPCHGAPITEPKPFLAAYKAHRLEREAQVMAQLAKGPQTIGQMVAVMYADVDVRLHPAAARSVLAHLIQLAREGRVLVEGGGAATAEATYRLG